MRSNHINMDITMLFYFHAHMHHHFPIKCSRYERNCLHLSVLMLHCIAPTEVNACS